MTSRRCRSVLFANVRLVYCGGAPRDRLRTTIDDRGDMARGNKETRCTISNR